MSYPDTLLVEIPTKVANELLVLLSDEPASDGLRLFLGHLRGDVRNALAQESMFSGGGE